MFAFVWEEENQKWQLSVPQHLNESIPRSMVYLVTRAHVGLALTVKASPQRRTLLILPLRSLNHDEDQVKMIASSIDALQFMWKLRHCFPTTARKIPASAAFDSDDSADDETRQEMIADRQPSMIALDTQITIFKSLEELKARYPNLETKDIQCISGKATYLAIFIPESNSETFSDVQLSKSSCDDNNIAVILTRSQSDRSEYLEVPTQIAPTILLQENTWDHTIISFGAARESSKFGAGKTPEEMLDDMKRRHASGSLCRIVEPTHTWKELVDQNEYLSSLPPSSEIRLRRIMGMHANENIQLVRAKEL